MTKYIRSFLIYFLLLAALALPRLAFAADLTIDFSQIIGPAQRHATGFEWLYLPNRTALEPFVTQLKPNIIKDPWTEGLRNSPINFGTARFQDIIGLKFTPINASFTGVWPYQDYVAWQTNVQNRVKDLTANGTKYDWAIWQEPDSPDPTVWNGTQAQFFETWRVAYNAIRALRPSDKIVGPSIWHYDQQYLQAFLTFVKANNVMPDMLSWNELSQFIGENGFTPENIPAHVNAIRQYMQANGFPALPIEITEYGMYKNEYQPGYWVSYITGIEQSQIEGSIGLWGQNNDPQQLLGMVTDPNTPQVRSEWWVYKSYADMTGQIVKTTFKTTINGLGSYDPTTNIAKVLVGNVGGSSGPKTITLNNLSQTLPSSGNVMVMVEQIPNTEKNPLTNPIILSNSLQPFNASTMNVPISALGSVDAALVTISKPISLNAALSGSQFTVNFTNSVAQSGDWIGLFVPGAANNAFLDWKWLDNTKVNTTPPASPVTSGHVTLSSTGLPAYEVRYIRLGVVLDKINVPVVTITPTPTPYGATTTPGPTIAIKPGDLNGDGKVDIFDYNIMIADFGKTGSPGFSRADINRDGKIDIFDYNTLLTNFGK